MQDPFLSRAYLLRSHKTLLRLVVTGTVQGLVIVPTKYSHEMHERGEYQVHGWWKCFHKIRAGDHVFVSASKVSFRFALHLTTHVTKACGKAG